MAKPETSDLWSRLAPTPLKGFIELTQDEGRVLIATHNIVGISDRGADGCTMTLTQSVIGMGGQAGVVYLGNSFDDVINLLKQAQ